MRGVQRRGFVALIALPDVLQNRLKAYLSAACLQFSPAAQSPHFRRSGHKKFHVGIGANDRADIAAVKHGAGLLLGKASLKLKERGAHFRNAGDDRSRGPTASVRNS